MKWCRAVGFTLFPWQENVLRDSLRGGMNGRPWGDSEVCLVVPRQQGKSELLVARQLFGLFMLPNERTIISTAHLVPTAKESFRKMIQRIDANPELKARVLHTYTANGQEGIELRDGSRIRFLARSKGSARGWTADLVVADEAYDLSEDEMAALTPTMTMSPNPQMWYASSTGMPDSYVLNSLRERGMAESPGLAYFEWSAPEDAENDDIEAILQANPSLGLSHMTINDVWRDLGSLEDERYRRERLGILAPIGEDGYIPMSSWRACLDEALAEMVVNGEVIEQKLDRVALAVDVPPDRSYASICVAGTRDDGSLFVELIDRREGTDWVASALRELMDAGGKVPVLADGMSAVAGLDLDFRRERVRVLYPKRDVYRKACGNFYEMVRRGGVRHKGDADLDAAVSGAQPTSVKEKLWAWTSSTVDVSPLVAATLAVHGSLNRPSGDKKPGRRRSVVV